RAATQVARVAAGDAEVGRVEAGAGDSAPADHVHGGGPGGGQLVQAVVAAEDQAGRASYGQDTGDDLGHRPVVDADRGGGGQGRVGQGRQEVEHGGDAEFAARPGGVLERRVEDGGEAEGDAHLFGHLRDGGGREVDDHAQFLQDVGGAGGGGGGPAAVFDHLGPGRGGDDGGHGGDVDGVGPVAAGADEVDGVAGDPDGGGPGEQPVGEPGQFGDGFSFGTQRDGEGRDLGVRGAPSHDLRHGPGRLPGGERLTVEERGEQCGPGGGAGHG